MDGQAMTKPSRPPDLDERAKRLFDIATGAIEVP
jgi:hypothetical protein